MPGTTAALQQVSPARIRGVNENTTCPSKCVSTWDPDVRALPLRRLERAYRSEQRRKRRSGSSPIVRTRTARCERGGGRGRKRRIGLRAWGPSLRSHHGRRAQHRLASVRPVYRGGRARSGTTRIHGVSAGRPTCGQPARHRLGRRRLREGWPRLRGVSVRTHVVRVSDHCRRRSYGEPSRRRAPPGMAASTSRADLPGMAGLLSTGACPAPRAVRPSQ